MFTLSRKRLIWIIALLLSIGLIVGIGLVVGSKKTQANGGAKKPVTLEFTVADLTYLEPVALQQSLAISGSLQPLRQATVKAKVSGEVKEVLVREGETIKQNQSLIRFDTADLDARLAEKLANREAAKAQFSLAEKNRATNQKLLQQNFISQQAYDAVQSTHQANKETVNAWDAQVQLAKNALRDAQVHSPLSGTVAKKYIQPGEKVSFDAPLLSVVDLSQLELQALVPASEVPRLRIGMKVTLKVDGFSERSFIGRLERINPATEPGTRSIMVFIALPNADAALKGGMFATGEIALLSTEPLLTLPQAAIRDENGQNFVWIIEQDKLARKNVVLGRRDHAANRVEIKGGLTRDMAVLANKFDNLKEGGLAKIRSSEAMSTAGRT